MYATMEVTHDEKHTSLLWHGVKYFWLDKSA
jgi:hypothetical protein